MTIQQAFELLKKRYCADRVCPQSITACKECAVGVVEAALKDYESLEAGLIFADMSIVDTKKLKALQIIKDLVYIDENNQIRFKPKGKIITTVVIPNKEIAILLKEVLL